MQLLLQMPFYLYNMSFTKQEKYCKILSFWRSTHAAFLKPDRTLSSPRSKSLRSLQVPKGIQVCALCAFLGLSPETALEEGEARSVSGFLNNPDLSSHSFISSPSLQLPGFARSVLDPTSLEQRPFHVLPFVTLCMISIFRYHCMENKLSWPQRRPYKFSPALGHATGISSNKKKKSTSSQLKLCSQEKEPGCVSYRHCELSLIPLGIVFVWCGLTLKME